MQTLWKGEALMAIIPDYPGLEPGETAWEGFGPHEVIIQKACEAEGCVKGLLYYPARFCPVCAGSGLVGRTMMRGSPYSSDTGPPCQRCGAETRFMNVPCATHTAHPSWICLCGSEMEAK